MRHAPHAYAIEGHPPHHVLERLETLLGQSRPGITVTLCLVLVTRTTTTCTSPTPTTSPRW
ncbi:hypothetical protein [Streptomyces pseudovenezuelae]|uniref:Uncharacterized protein n=1 Tax=Streptomyces pseudovenezuelae TaxID=67350 RepID=A0ABT6LRQ9_9ACTN|nr:hypothetical protein [Streptomyces pseudovenezuelae]MDH6218937.1 hypothetical protein [Streptomyces pseudovenezuelae]